MKTETLQRTWELFKVPNAVVEVRALGVSGKHRAWDGYTSHTVTGYFDDGEAFVEAVSALDAASRASGIYITLNPVNPDLLARANNRLVAAKRGETTTDADILFRRWLLLDFDPVRPAGISSTRAELQLALETAKHARAFLCEVCEWPLHTMRMACSGNGIHLLMRMNEPNDVTTRDHVKTILEHAQRMFATGSVALDTNVYNAARITKLYGTVARKGDATAERKHRLSGFIDEVHAAESEATA